MPGRIRLQIGFVQIDGGHAFSPGLETGSPSPLIPPQSGGLRRRSSARALLDRLDARAEPQDIELASSTADGTLAGELPAD